jgi:arylsulfatase
VTERPNVLLVMTDQQRGDCLGVDEHSRGVLTPNLDELAAAGTRFARAYSSCPICTPARRSLLSGQSPATHGVLSYDNQVDWQIEQTLPAMFRGAGYQTYLVGRDMDQHPTRKRQGFDEMVTDHDYVNWLAGNIPVETEHREGLYQSPNLESGVMHNDWTAHPWPYADALHQTNWTVTETRRFLRRRDPVCPFFLVVSFSAPHPPLLAPPFYFERYLRMELPDPVVGSWAERPRITPAVAGIDVALEGETLRSCLAGYLGLINHVDDQLRRFIYGLHGIEGFDLANTIIVFTSDHGEMLGDHYRWFKAQPYEGAARIPLIIRAPARFEFEPGRVINQPVCLEDVMPTLLDLAEISPPDRIDGRSLVPLMRGDESEFRSWLHLEHGRGRARPELCWHALTDGREKYIWFSEDGREQLFDLVHDPHELEDLATIDVASTRLARWRERLTSQLAGRPEGFVENGALIAGREHAPVMAHAQPASTA